MSELKKCTQPERWVQVDEDCPACGANAVEIFTAETDGNFWEGEEMRCTECGATGEWYENDHGFCMLLTTKWTLNALRTENEAQTKEIEELKSKVAELEGFLHNEMVRADAYMGLATELRMANKRMRKALGKVADEDYFVDGMDYIDQCPKIARKALKGGE